MKCRDCGKEVIEVYDGRGWIVINFSSVDDEDIILLASKVRLAFKSTHTPHTCEIIDDKNNKQDRQYQSIANRHKR